MHRHCSRRRTDMGSLRRKDQTACFFSMFLLFLCFFSFFLVSLSFSKTSYFSYGSPKHANSKHGSVLDHHHNDHRHRHHRHHLPNTINGGFTGSSSRTKSNGDVFKDDKRRVYTGPNPLHNR